MEKSIVTSPAGVSQLLDNLFRQEAGKLAAVLTRMLGMQQWEQAQDLVQDTLLQAMTTWGYGNIPDQPVAWLHRVARNKTIDYLRRQQRFHSIATLYGQQQLQEASTGKDDFTCFLDAEIEDSQLRMMFACCHPGIPEEGQMALVLKTLCGLSTAEIARSFLCAEETIQKRVYRARERIRQEQVELDVPQAHELQSRIDVVLHCIYLLFNEGYLSAHADQAIREDLCREAMRLCLILTRHTYTSLPRVQALMALLCFQAARLPARLNEQQQLVLLRLQNRSLWHRELIGEGFRFLEQAAAPFEISRYHLEAGIASLHAAAPDFESTKWTAIYTLYSHLYRHSPSTIVALNKAIAAAYAIGAGEALQQLKQISGLEHYYLYHAALGEVYQLLQQPHEARQCYERALALTPSAAEVVLLRQKLQHC